MVPSRSQQLLLLLLATAVTCTAEPQPEAQGLWKNAPRRAAHQRSAFPNPEFDDWQPIGHGDPLSNAPTFQYAPPVMARPAEARNDDWPIRPRNPSVRVVTQTSNRRRDGPFSGSFFQFRRPGRKPQRRPRPGSGLSYITSPQFGAPQGERRDDFRGPPETPEYTQEPTRLFAGQSNFEPQREFVPQRDTSQQEFQAPPQFQGRPNFQEQERFERPEFQGQQNGPEQPQLQERPTFQERPNFSQEQNSVEPQRFEEPQQFQPPVRAEQQRPPFFQDQPPQPPQQPPQQQRRPQPLQQQRRPQPPRPQPQPQQPPQPRPQSQPRPQPQPQQQSQPRPQPQPQPQSQPRPQPQPRPQSQPRPQPQPQPQSRPKPQSQQPQPQQQQDEKEQEEEEERLVQQRKELIRQKLQQQQRKQLRQKLQQQRQRQEQQQKQEEKQQETPDQAAEETQSETFVRVPPARGQQNFVQPTIDKSPFVQIEPPKRQEIPPPEEPSTTTQRVVVTTTRRQRRPNRNRRPRPPFRTTTEKTTEAATKPTTTRTTTTERRPSTSAATTTTTTTTTTERAETTTAARTPPSSTATTTTTTRATITTKRRPPPTTTRRTTTERIVAERRPTLAGRRRVPLSSLLGKRPARPDPVRFSSRPQRPRPSLFRRPLTPKPQVTTKAPTTTRRRTTARPSPTTQRPVPTRQPVRSAEERQKLVSRLAELRATRRPRPSVLNRLPLSATPPSRATTRRPPIIAVTAATAAAAPTAAAPKTTTTNKPKPRRPTTARVPVHPAQPFFSPTSAPFPVQQTEAVSVAKAPYVHQSGYSKIKMFGINVNGKSRGKKPAKKYKKPIYPIRIESRVKMTTAAPRTTTEAPRTSAETTQPNVRLTTTLPPSPPPSTAATVTPIELAAAVQYAQPEVNEEVPVREEQTDANDEDYEDSEAFTDDHAMMEKMYFEADGDPELMEASGNGEHFHDFQEPVKHEAFGIHSFQEPVEHEAFSIPEFQYEPVPPPAHAFRPQVAPPLPARRADHVTYREGDEPVPRPPAPGGDGERGQGRPGPPQRPRPAGASSWMTGLLSSLFSRPKESEPTRPAPSPVSLLSGLFGGGGGGSFRGPPERRPPPAVDPYGFAPPTDNDPLATSASESVVVTDAAGEPLRPPAAFRNVPALAGLFANLPSGDQPRFAQAARRSDSRPAPVRPVFFAKRQEAAERTDRAEVSRPFEYASTLDGLKGRLPVPEMVVEEPTPPPELVATRVPAQ